MSTSSSTMPAIEIGNLPDDVGVLKIYVQQLWTELAKERAELQALREHFDVFLKRYYGPKGEKLDPAQRLLFDVALDPALAQLLNLSTPEQPASDENHSEETALIELPDDDDDDDEAKRKKSAHGRRRIPAHVRRHVIVVDFSLVEKSILEGEGELRELPAQVSEYYEWIPPMLVVRRRIRKEWSAVPKSELHKLVAQARQEKAQPILDESKEWLEALRQKPLLPKSQLAKAVTYVENQWDALVRYVDDGRLKPDNNTAARALRGIAIGRRNWLFCGSERGGQTAAVFFSVISSAIRNGLEPLQYLCMLLTEIPKLGESPTPDQLAPLMPHVWKAPAPVVTTTTVTSDLESAAAPTTAPV